MPLDQPERWTRIFIHIDRLAGEETLDDMEEFLCMRDCPSNYSVTLSEDDRRKVIGLIFRIARRDLALDFRDRFA